MGLPFERMQRTVLTKRTAETSSKYGHEPSNRPIKRLLQYGIVNVDKPQGPTSHQVSAYVQSILKLTKGGHSGTLDPNVTGVLPVALGDGTKIVQALLPAGKEYICLMHLHGDYSEKEIRKACKKFVGKIKQLPPLRSAVKRQWRYRKIYYLDVLDINGRDVLFRVGCQAGTYIRKLCHDIGHALGSSGHMQELRRTKAGGFNEETLTTLQELTDAVWYYENEGNEKLLRKHILPVEAGIAHLPKVWVLDTTVDTLCHGASLKAPGIAKVESDIQVGELVAVLSLKGELIVLGKAEMISKDMVKKERGVAVSIERVFMDPKTYPKCEF